MKKVLNIGLGSRSFIIDEDAYLRLDLYLTQFKRKAQMGADSVEMMDDLEMRIADMFLDSLSSRVEVVNIRLVDRVIRQLGMPDGSAFNQYADPASTGYTYSTAKKLYRDPNHTALAGVCSGLAAYFNIDILLVRILFLIALFLGSAGFWVYIIFWIVAPLARTPSQKCEMHGLPITAENLRKFSTYGS